MRLFVAYRYTYHAHVDVGGSLFKLRRTIIMDFGWQRSGHIVAACWSRIFVCVRVRELVCRIYCIANLCCPFPSKTPTSPTCITYDFARGAHWHHYYRHCRSRCCWETHIIIIIIMLLWTHTAHFLSRSSIRPADVLIRFHDRNIRTQLQLRSHAAYALFAGILLKILSQTEIRAVHVWKVSTKLVSNTLGSLLLLTMQTGKKCQCIRFLQQCVSCSQSSNMSWMCLCW